MHALRIDLRFPGLIREFKHSNSNMRHERLNSKGSLFLGHSVQCCFVNVQIREESVLVHMRVLSPDACGTTRVTPTHPTCRVSWGQRAQTTTREVRFVMLLIDTHSTLYRECSTTPKLRSVIQSADMHVSALCHEYRIVHVEVRDGSVRIRMKVLSPHACVTTRRRQRTQACSDRHQSLLCDG